MIKRVVSVKNFGLFKNFQWANPLVDFREKNVIYGWNYSGKTTLSRILSSLRDKALHTKYPGGEFTVSHGQPAVNVSHSNLGDFPFPVAVYNSEYVRANLKWDQSTEKLEPIAFDVGTNVQIRERINRNLELIQKITGNETIKGRVEAYHDVRKIYAEFEDFKFTNEARRIKNDEFLSLIEFDKKYLRETISDIEHDVASYIITDANQLEQVKKTALAKNDKPKIAMVNFSDSIKSLYEEVAAILLSEPSKEETIKVLEDNKDLYNWSTAGLKLHTESKQMECAFCGNELTADRLKKLNEYFSNESGKLREKISNLRNRLIEEEQKLIAIVLPASKNDLAEKCQTDYLTLLNKKANVIAEANGFLKILGEELVNKEIGNIFNAVIPPEYNAKPETNLKDWIAKINDVINAHNEFVDRFDEEQNAARYNFVCHLVAQFITNENYLDKKERGKEAVNTINKYNELKGRIETRNQKLYESLKSVVAGKAELNKFIKDFLNRDDLQIEVTNDDKFRLKRGDKFAENLSEGEKTAISFSYFLVQLESLHKSGQLANYIIFIDDPISSLDGNHIAQVYSLINSFFFRKNLDAANPERVVNCFKQLFISTHNFEFFSFLKDSNRLNSKVKADPNSGCGYYLLRRKGVDDTDLIPLPNSLRIKSEYVYLFELLYNFKQGGCDINDPNIILLPNAVRRFLEIYTLTKLPGSTGEVDSRLAILMGGVSNLKVLHHFSHFTTLEKVMKHDELLANLPAATDELFNLLGQDKAHFESLKEAIGAA